MNTVTTEAARLVIPEKIHCRSIGIMDLIVTTSDDFRNEPKVPHHHSFSIGKNIAHNISKKSARYQLFFVIEAMNEEDQPIGITASISIEFHYEIENLHDNIKEENDEISLNTNLVGTILGMSYSTSRGIILEKLQNTLMGGIILPCIDPYKVLTEGESKK